jgi:hypothetical protein
MIKSRAILVTGLCAILARHGFASNVSAPLLPKKTYSKGTAEIQSPSGDPLAAPSAANQFTLSGENGVTTIPVQAVVTPSRLGASLGNQIKWTLGGLPPTITVTWDHPWPGDSASGQGLSAVATLTGYPANNSDFGVKTLKMALVRPSDNKVFNERSTSIALFFKRDDVATARTPIPNWFFYWRQVVAGTANTEHVPDIAPVPGRTPAMRLWSTYGGPRAQTWYSSSVTGPGVRSDGSDEIVTGIDFFANVVAHENQHVQEIFQENSQPFFSGNTGILRAAPAAGWSFNVAFSSAAGALWNHFTDSNHNEGFDAVDTDLDPDRDDVASTLEPTPAQEAQCRHGSSNDIECKAELNETIPQDQYLPVDWGNPGKQHF